MRKTTLSVECDTTPVPGGRFVRQCRITLHNWRDGFTVVLFFCTGTFSRPS